MNYPNSLAVIILAAGKGKRMLDDSLPKVLFQLNHKPLIGYVIDTVAQLSPDVIVPIIGFHKEQVEEYLNDTYNYNFQYAVQSEQLGTGHAVMQANSALSAFSGNILILPGDVPLITYKSLNKFIELHAENNSDLSVLSTIAPDATGYGRIVRNNNNEFERIVEHKDASDSEKLINEINSGVIICRSELLFSALSEVKSNNAQREYYLTDIIEIAKKSGKRVFAFSSAEFSELQGINTQSELKEVESRLNK